MSTKRGGSNVSQHFLLSTAARSLSLTRVARMPNEEAAETFKQLRWNATNGDPICARCGCLGVYAYKSRALFKCKACKHQFSITSGTIFSSRKLPVQTILLAIAIFVNSAKGHSALQLSRDLDVQYKTAFVLSHKLREALVSRHLAAYAAYADEMAWREDNRRRSNGEQYLFAVSAALSHPVSRQWKGYWQRPRML